MSVAEMGEGLWERWIVCGFLVVSSLGLSVIGPFSG